MAANDTRINDDESGLYGVNYVEVWDTTDTEFVVTTRGVHIGVAGDLEVRLKDMTTTETIPSVTAGDHPYRIDEIVAAGTTATDITFLW